jgi:hypothetical protein
VDKKVAEPIASYSMAAPQDVLAQIDQMMEQLARLRAQIAGMLVRQPESTQSIREADYFGMWADREDMQGLDSSEWLRRLREKQWACL